MIKKLIALLLLSSAAHAFSPVRYVQISTNTLSKQSGAINISTEAVNVSTIGVLSVSTITVVSSATIPVLSVSTLTVVSTGTFANIGITTAQISTATVGNVIVSSNIVFNPTTSGIKGTTTNNNTDPANVGAYLEDNHAAINVPTSTHYTAISTITLTAGDWDVTGIAVFTAAGAVSVTDLEMLITPTSGDNITGGTTGVNYVFGNALTTGVTNNTIVIPVYRVSIASSTPYYLKVAATYASGGPPQTSVRLSARRVR